MKCSVVFQSIVSWRRLSSILMQPEIALRILRYTKLVEAEYNHIEKLRVALAYEISGAAEGTEVKIDPNTSEAQEFSERFGDVLNEESDLISLRLSLDDVIHALEGEKDSLTISDLALLEPFFLTEYDDLGFVQPDGDCSE